MIDKREILDQAAATGLNPHIVEKDYVLGWLLWGVANHEATADNWIFKGGTCLKKCFFETYRFSEDLDFTLTDPAHLDEDFLRNVFTDISVAVYDRTGIEIPVDRQRFDLLYQGSTRRIEPYSLPAPRRATSSSTPTTATRTPTAATVSTAFKAPVSPTRALRRASLSNSHRPARFPFHPPRPARPLFAPIAAAPMARPMSTNAPIAASGSIARPARAGSTSTRTRPATPVQGAPPTTSIPVTD